MLARYRTRMSRGQSVSLGAILILAVLLIGCASTAAVPRSSETAGMKPAIDVVLREFSFEPNPLKVSAGKVRFRLMNRGAVEHDFSIIGVMRHERMRHENHLIQPGETRAIEVNLRPGVYEAVCTIQGHREAGMKVTVEAGSPSEN